MNLAHLLPLVSRPARYIGNEWNSVHKDHRKQRLKIALAFPDVYEVGMSHLGLAILYHLLNAQEGVVAERAFLEAMGGGCSTAVTSQGVVNGDTIKLRGMALGSDGILYASEEGSVLALEKVARRLAHRLLEMGAGQSAVEE